jgi:serine/threonine protein kinase
MTINHISETLKRPRKEECDNPKRQKKETTDTKTSGIFQERVKKSADALTVPPGRSLDNKFRVYNRASLGYPLFGQGGSKKAKGSVNLQTGEFKITLIGLVKASSERERVFFEALVKSNKTVKSLMKCDHIEEYVDKRGRQKIAFVQDYMNLGALDKALKSGRLTPDEAWEAIGSLLNGLKELNELGFYHRDIKPENIFVHRDQNGQIHVKIGDFDLACRMDDSRERGKMSGTSVFMSTESLTRMSEVVDKQDVWAMGIVLFELITNKKTPWHETSERYIQDKKVTREEYNRLVFADIEQNEGKRDIWFPVKLKEDPIGAIIFDMLDPSHAKRPSIPQMWNRFEEACKEPDRKQKFLDLYQHFLSALEPTLVPSESSPPLEEYVKTQEV